MGNHLAEGAAVGALYRPRPLTEARYADRALTRDRHTRREAYPPVTGHHDHDPRKRSSHPPGCALSAPFRQADSLKRRRDIRPQLAAEGIVVLGHQNNSPSVAHSSGLPVSRKKTLLAVRLVRITGTTDRRIVEVDGDTYAVARGDDPFEPARHIRY
ncbi:NaeI family type II restriction endonuclease [Saccharothrix carnea]|uniref:NaeI family type II restriction endonuclease n=1 Tax=Saccharothrix TaxID=2071 RepID=UPI0011610416